MQVTLPSLERFLKDSRPWGLAQRHPEGGWGGGAYEMQRTTPDPNDLLKKVGITPGQRVLIVAGHRADWALALARAGAKVTYSDLSPELTAFAKKNVRHRNIVQYTCVSYLLYPDVPIEYDWTFTFEAVGPKPFIFFRALLNREGGKYVLWDSGDHAQRKLEDLAEAANLCEKLYRVKTATVSRNILCQDRRAGKELRPHRVLTIRTSNTARATMVFDLRVFHFFYRRKKAKTDELRLLLRCTDKELRQSMKRLSKWCTLFKGKYSKERELRT